MGPIHPHLNFRRELLEIFGKIAEVKAHAPQGMKEMTLQTEERPIEMEITNPETGGMHAVCCINNVRKVRRKDKP